MQPPPSGTISAAATNINVSASRIGAKTVQAKVPGSIMAVLQHIARNNSMEFVAIAGPLIVGTALVHRGFVSYRNGMKVPERS